VKETRHDGSNVERRRWGMGLIALLVVIVLVLAAAALVKYLFFSKRP
jgi:hypothetical protein